MRIIQFLTALTILLAPALASAQVKPYIEGQIGLLTSASDTGVKSTSPVATGEIKADIEIDPDTVFGVEIGVREIAGTGFRLGLSYSQTDSETELKNGSGSLTVTIPGVINPITVEGSSFNSAKEDQTLKIVSLNLYHDFDIGSPVMPYVGAGLGFGEIEDTDSEIVMSLHAGANYDINENFYVGARASFHQISGLTREAPAGKDEYDDFNTWTLGVVGGVKF